MVEKVKVKLPDLDLYFLDVEDKDAAVLWWMSLEGGSRRWCCKSLLGLRMLLRRKLSGRLALLVTLKGVSMLTLLIHNLLSDNF